MFYIEILFLILIILSAIFATRLAKKSNDEGAQTQRLNHHIRKMEELNNEILGLYRKDLPGVLRYPLNSMNANGYLVRYKFYLQELITYKTIDAPEFQELVPKTRWTIERLIQQVHLQEKINAVVGDSIFPDDSKQPLIIPNLSTVSVDDLILEDIKHDFQVFEKHFHDATFVQEDEPEEKAREIVDKLPDSKNFTYFFDETTFYIILSDDFGVFVQNILEGLNVESYYWGQH
ncbi:MAG: hypothetical protein LBD38_01970 [Streptococcaceae bacterium]|jgi:hypothetical protein|nr:hypothetical protein [Streptococcaceae bacterium]